MVQPNRANLWVASNDHQLISPSFVLSYADLSFPDEPITLSNASPPYPRPSFSLNYLLFRSMMMDHDAMDIDSPIQSRFHRSRKVRITSMSLLSPWSNSWLTIFFLLYRTTLYHFSYLYLLVSPTYSRRCGFSYQAGYSPSTWPIRYRFRRRGTNSHDLGH
jgi:hypothetical protein